VNIIIQNYKSSNLNNVSSSYTIKDCIKVADVYRSQDSITNNKYNYFFIDEFGENKEKKHFFLFINSIKDYVKLKGISFYLKKYLPLISNQRSDSLSRALKDKLLNRNIEITYESKEAGNIIEYIEFK
jgi:hypothetical protein